MGILCNVVGHRVPQELGGRAERVDVGPWAGEHLRITQQCARCGVEFPVALVDVRPAGREGIVIDAVPEHSLDKLGHAAADVGRGRLVHPLTAPAISP